MQPEKLDMRGVGTAEVLDTIADNDDAGPARNARPNGKPPRGRRAVPLPAAAPSVAPIAAADRDKALRIVEALLFAAPEPLDEAFLGRHLPAGADTRALLDELKAFYSGRGVNLVRVAGKWAFRTASDLAYLLERHAVEERKLSKAALETLAIVAYHQPVTRAEIEEIRGVETSKGTLDILLETGWVRLRGRRRAPGKPLTFGTTERFLDQFGLESIKDLPGLAELKTAGLLDATLPPGFQIPSPTDVAALMPDELPLEAAEEPEQTELDLDTDPDEDTRNEVAGIAKAGHVKVGDGKAGGRRAGRSAEGES